MKSDSVVCARPVEIYDPELRGVYQPGQTFDGAKGQALVAKYPETFSLIPGRPEPLKEGK